MASDTTRMSIDIAKKDHKKLKTLASSQGLTIRELVLAVLGTVLHPSKRPNETTRKVLEATDRGRGLKSFDSAQELFDDLGI